MNTLELITLIISLLGTVILIGVLIGFIVLTIKDNIWWRNHG